MSELSIDTLSVLPGTVKFYDQHLIVCTGHANWASKIEDDGGFVKHITDAVKSANIPGFVRLTACHAPVSKTGVDVMLYPAAQKFIGLTQADIPALLAALRGETGSALTAVSLTRPVWLVCAHHARDPRCGACGPGLLAAFANQLQKAGLSNSVAVRPSSHLGGHRFAGVVVCYPSGNWYGRVMPADVPALIQAELIDGTHLPRLWRGRIGMSPEEQIKFASEA